MQKLKFLLGRYGEATVLNTIKGIARTPFLLGKKEHSTWSVSLAWLLDADNFSKVLAGKYCDNNTDAGCYESWKNGEPFPFYLPGEREGDGPMAAEQFDQALDDLFHPRSELLDETARILALPC